MKRSSESSWEWPTRRGSEKEVKEREVGVQIWKGPRERSTRQVREGGQRGQREGRGRSKRAVAEDSDESTLS